VDEDGKLPKIGKFIMLGFPQTELHIEKMKEYGIGFDRIIFLNDTSEEEPGKVLAERLKKSSKGGVLDFEWEKVNDKA
jgi:hypothetical protein